MAFSITICPYCGAEIGLDDNGNYVCKECGKRTLRSRSNFKGFLLNKPYQEEYSHIIGLSEEKPAEALKMINAIIDSAQEENADMYFVRGIVYATLGEEGKAGIDWRKGLNLITDFRFIDYYIVAVCKRIVELIFMKEREFMDFNPTEYIDLLATEFRVKSGVPCKGVFYITIYRNFRIDLQAGEFTIDDDVYQPTINKVLNRILAYGRNFRTTSGIVEEILEDFGYNPETYEEDDNLKLHMCSLLINRYEELSKNFSDEHLLRIFRHWNDENMFEMEYWVDQLVRSVRDNAILQSLRRFSVSEKEDFNLESAVDDYARKFLLLGENGEDLSQDP
jgi:hypothetical protein